MKKLKFLTIIAIFCLFACALKKEPMPEPPALVHRVSYSGETLALIAQWYTGNVHNWKIIQGYNQNLNVHRINIGDEILIPRKLVIKEEPLPRHLVGRWAGVRKETEDTKKDSSFVEVPENELEQKIVEENKTNTETLPESTISSEVSSSSSSSSVAVVTESAPASAASSSSASSVSEPVTTNTTEVTKVPEDQATTANKSREDYLRDLLEAQEKN